MVKKMMWPSNDGSSEAVLTCAPHVCSKLCYAPGN